MSSLIVQVCVVDDILPHPNADRMEVCVVKGWRTCIAKGQFHKGDRCVYIPPDSVLPKELSDKLKVTQYLQPLPKDATGARPEGGRVRVARLRGERSYGLLMPCENDDWPVGQDVAHFYGITKWDPPEKCTDGDAERPNPAFLKYTNIEHYRNFPQVLRPGEDVVITEKIHGKNVRLGYIRGQDENGNQTYNFVAGSHSVQRKEYVTYSKTITDEVTGEDKLVVKIVRSQFWECLTEPVKELMRDLSGGKKDVIVYGELYGRGQQDLWYGTEFGFRVFDIMVDGQFLDFPAKEFVLKHYGVEMVPVLYEGPFSPEKVEELVEGPTTLCSPEEAGAFKGREGIVITPKIERTDPNLSGTGRVILKAVSFAYLERRGGTEDH